MHLDYWSAQHTRRHTLSHTHTYTHSQAHTLSLPLLQSSVQNQSTFTFMLGPAHCSCPCPPVPCHPPPFPCLVVGSLWGRMSECWPVFWPCPCFVNVQNLSNFIMLEFAGTSQLPQQQPQHDCTSPLLLLPSFLPVCCQLLWRLTSAHYKAQESSRTTSSATTSGSAPSLPHDSWHFEARHQLVMS